MSRDENGIVRRPSYIRTDPLNETERELAAFLRQQHLPGVDADDEAAVAMEIEQARLLLFGVAAVIFFAVSQLLTLARPICASPLYGSLFLLLIALLGSWDALLGGAKLRASRVDRRYAMYDAERSHYLAARRGIGTLNQNTLNQTWDEIIAPEVAMRSGLFRKRRFNVWIAGAGIGCALWSAIGSTERSVCPTKLHIPDKIVKQAA